MHGVGFPAGDTVKVAYNLGPGQDWPLSSSPVQTDAQGSFTVTFSSVLLSTSAGTTGT